MRHQSASVGFDDSSSDEDESNYIHDTITTKDTTMVLQPRKTETVQEFSQKCLRTFEFRSDENHARYDGSHDRGENNWQEHEDKVTHGLLYYQPSTGMVTRIKPEKVAQEELRRHAFTFLIKHAQFKDAVRESTSRPSSCSSLCSSLCALLVVSMWRQTSRLGLPFTLY